MNQSRSSRIEDATECNHIFYKSFLQLSFSGSYRSFLIAAVVITLVACPFTVLLNAIVIAAVKTKQQLQTVTNILLASMALTDLITGLITQPLYITMTYYLVIGRTLRGICNISLTVSISYFLTFWASVVHLFLISGERYFAMKYTFRHGSFITKGRLLAACAVPWITSALLIYSFTQSATLFYILVAIIIFTTILLHRLVYKEAKRHEKQIMLEQVTEEARTKFQREKKALKLTSMIFAAIFLCCVLPVAVRFVTLNVFDEYFSSDSKTSLRQATFVLSFFNSLINPVIYTVRKREFQIAFRKLLSPKCFRETVEVKRSLGMPRPKKSTVIPEDIWGDEITNTSRELGSLRRVNEKKETKKKTKEHYSDSYEVR